MTTTTAPSVFRDLPYMGVIRVNVAAMERGYRMGSPEWANLGQGQPEVGDMDGAPPRIDTVRLDPGDHAYGAIEGVDDLREAVAAHYNRLYRPGMASLYTAENVALAAGGRLALSRCGAALDDVRLGYFTPDYTAYEDLLTTFSRVTPVWIELAAARGFRIAPDELEARVERDRIDALLISNPCNPTGVAVAGSELAAWVEMARRRGTTLLMDEFYSHFAYAPTLPGRTEAHPISSASFVEDVDEDPVVIFDGLTKGFRYPGWRIGWVLAPRRVIRAFAAAGSFLDGGPSRIVQRAAMAALEPDQADRETDAVRHVFRAKRDLVLERLGALGVGFPVRDSGTFYAFGDISALPSGINEGESFMRAGFDHRVLTVPGEYFDVNPGRQRTGASALERFVRFSFGPPMDVVRGGLDRLEEMVRAHVK